MNIHILLAIVSTVAALAAFASMAALGTCIYEFRLFRKSIESLRSEMLETREADMELLKSWLHNARVEDQKDLMTWVQNTINSGSHVLPIDSVPFS